MVNEVTFVGFRGGRSPPWIRPCPYKSHVSLPVATNVSTSHDAKSIRNFMDEFLKNQTKLRGKQKTPLVIIRWIDANVECGFVFHVLRES